MASFRKKRARIADDTGKQSKIIFDQDGMSVTIMGAANILFVSSKYIKFIDVCTGIDLVQRPTLENIVWRGYGCF